MTSLLNEGPQTPTSKVCYEPVIYNSPEEERADFERIQALLGPMEYDPTDEAREEHSFGSDDEDRRYYRRTDRAEWLSD
jgi:hypothetical protein